jgi:hypothetical protein
MNRPTDRPNVSPADATLARYASEHSAERHHHVALIPSEGWLCEQCDDDFADYIGERFAHHFRP